MYDSLMVRLQNEIRTFLDLAKSGSATLADENGDWEQIDRKIVQFINVIELRIVEIDQQYSHEIQLMPQWVKDQVQLQLTKPEEFKKQEEAESNFRCLAVSLAVVFVLFLIISLLIYQHLSISWVFTLPRKIDTALDHIEKWQVIALATFAFLTVILDPAAQSVCSCFSRGCQTICCLLTTLLILYIIGMCGFEVVDPPWAARGTFAFHLEKEPKFPHGNFPLKISQWQFPRIDVENTKLLKYISAGCLAIIAVNFIRKCLSGFTSPGFRQVWSNRMLGFFRFLHSEFGLSSYFSTTGPSESRGRDVFSQSGRFPATPDSWTVVGRSLAGDGAMNAFTELKLELEDAPKNQDQGASNARNNNIVASTGQDNSADEVV